VDLVPYLITLWLSKCRFEIFGPRHRFWCLSGAERVRDFLNGVKWMMARLSRGGFGGFWL